MGQAPAALAGGWRGPRPVEAAPEALLTVAEVAARLRVCKATVYRLCADGKLRHVRVLDAIRVAPAAVAELLAGT